MKLILFIALLLPCALFAQKMPKDTVFNIEGKIEMPTPLKIYLIYQIEGRRFIDSSHVLNHVFHFTGVAGNPVFATLAMDHEGKGFKNLMSKFADEIDLLYFYVHSGTISLIAKDSIANAFFTVSAMNKDYDRLKTMLNKSADNQLAHLSANMLREKTKQAEDRYETFYDSLKSARRPFLKRFVIDNPSSYIALIALQDYAGAFPDPVEIKPLYDALSPAVKSTKAGIAFNALLNSEKALAVGSLAPDFIQNDTSGKPVALSSFRGKYVLIDFWASWCAPCRENNPALVKIYDALKDKNFTILGVSLDSQDTKAEWIKAIRHDGLNWPQVSDLKHWDNGVIKQYGINAIPQNILIDPDGKIFAKNVEPDEIKTIVEKPGKNR